MHPPKIFISATSGDLRSVRQIVKEALLTINCHPAGGFLNFIAETLAVGHSLHAVKTVGMDQ